MKSARSITPASEDEAFVRCVSGGHYTQDMAVAQAGLAVLTQAGG
jgi:hypothetical protein